MNGDGMDGGATGDGGGEITLAIAGGAFDQFVPVYTLLKTAFADHEGVIDPPSSVSRLTVDDVIADARAGTLMLVECDGDIVGCAFLKQVEEVIPTLEEKPARVMYLYHLGVAPVARRRGIARDFFNLAEMLTKQHALPALIVKSRVELTANHALFRKLGFTQIAETRHPGYDRTTSLTFLKGV